MPTVSSKLLLTPAGRGAQVEAMVGCLAGGSERGNQTRPRPRPTSSAPTSQASSPNLCSRSKSVQRLRSTARSVHVSVWACYWAGYLTPGWVAENWVTRRAGKSKDARVKLRQVVKGLHAMPTCQGHVCWGWYIETMMPFRLPRSLHEDNDDAAAGEEIEPVTAPGDAAGVVLHKRGVI